MAAQTPSLRFLISVAALVALAAVIVDGWHDLWLLSQVQAPGADYSCFWAGAKAALSRPDKLYDFAYITGLQGWPLGPQNLRPYIYPPSALFVFTPFALMPYWAGFALWVGLTAALFTWAGVKAGAPWFLILAPPALLILNCGQVTFLVGGLAIAAFALRERSIAAGVLLGLAAVVKPQLVLLAPIALIADGRWRTLFVMGLTGLVVCAAALAAFGLQPWLDWLAALPRFREVIFTHPGLVADAVTPYAFLEHRGLPGAWAYALAPLAAAAVWFAFKKPLALPDRLIAFFGAGLVLTPYAMNYELALFAPAVGAYLMRRKDKLWPLYVLLAAAHYRLPWTFASVLPVLLLPAAGYLSQRLEAGWSARPVFKS
ncbi:glycosyltransferase family 87 protein [Phenylobacterium sp. LjRoot219]|uniref:glycosyltransferase family 87 protein n=1 Tax=Phenylobacterium sp. LjRoot219 TaxID=3342283 RepID=UPI003ECCBC54